MRRYPALAAVVFAVAAVTAPSALADSIVYEKSGNVWLANPDGSGQHQVTTAGGYGKPSQADDDTIIAAKDAVLHHLSRSGQLLNLAGAIGKAKRAVSGSATLRVKPTRQGRARLLRGGKSVSVRVTGAGRTVTRKVKILR